MDYQGLVVKSQPGARKRLAHTYTVLRATANGSGQRSNENGWL